MGGRHRGIVYRAARQAWLACGLLAIAGCTPIYRDHGYVPSDSQLAEIDVGVDTRETVAVAVGTPSTSGLLQDSGYFYVSQRFRSFGLEAPEIVDRQVVAISFDSRGVVSNVERFGLEDGNVVALSRRVTDSSIQGVGFLRQLLGNVGRLDIGENVR